MVIRLPKFDDQYVESQFIQQQRPLFWWKKARDLAEAVIPWPLGISNRKMIIYEGLDAKRVIG